MTRIRIAILLTGILLTGTLSSKSTIAYASIRSHTGTYPVNNLFFSDDDGLIPGFILQPTLQILPLSTHSRETAPKWFASTHQEKPFLYTSLSGHFIPVLSYACRCLNVSILLFPFHEFW